MASLRNIGLVLLGVMTLAIASLPLTGLPDASTAAAAGDCTTSDVLEPDEQAFLTLINNYRAQNGRAPLHVSYTLSKAAQWKSTDMGINAYFAHDDLDRTWVQRIRDCGYGYGTYLGENIAAGYGNAQAVFDGWKNSPGHNANMLSANYTAIGIGKAIVPGSPYGTYWSTEFGGYDDGWSVITDVPAPALSPTISLDTTVSGKTLRVTANAAGASSVDFFLDGALIAHDAETPFTARTTLRGRREHSLLVRASWPDGQTAEARATVPTR